MGVTPVKIMLVVFLSFEMARVSSPILYIIVTKKVDKQV